MRKLPIKSALYEYGRRMRQFRPNARYYLLTVAITGIGMGVYRLIFNFYVLSLGYDEALLGKLITTNQIIALLLALPMGYAVDRFGRKNGLIARSVLIAVSVGGVALFPSVAMFYAMNAFFGIAQSISAVTMAPFLMENSGEQERTYLFSFSSGLMMGSAFVGNWLGGYLPTWIGDWLNISPTDSAAYSGALTVTALIAMLGFIPLLFIRVSATQKSARKDFAPLQYAKENPKTLGKLLIPTMIISVGAGLFMPFMNIFFRSVHGQSDQVIGTLFAWGSLAMGIGLIIAPPIAERLGKIQFVVLTQGLAIPFMILLGFAPFAISALAYYARLALMNMSNPIYQTFVMEQVDGSVRATVASLYSMVWSFGRAFSPTISGWLQVEYGFDPVFSIAIFLYISAILLYWIFFLRPAKQPFIAVNTP
ncbi:MAG TPA: MFS transporter [Anaerolineales bacterium]|nr:MFS transporter [Anaerolineales bacterium]